MGYIIYDVITGAASAYYLKEDVANMQAAKKNAYRYPANSLFEVIPYQEYEGVLMGLEGEDLRFWNWIQPPWAKLVNPDETVDVNCETTLQGIK